MPVVLDIQPAGYADAAHILGDVVAEQVRLAWVGLQATLDSAAGMAGSDDVGSSWGGSYDAAARSATQATEDTCNACYQLAALLEQTAINYEGAEAASMPGSSARVSANHWARAAASLGELQTAIGQGTPQPGGWSVLQHAIGYVWPNGHQDLLRAAAAGWDRAASRIEALVTDVGQAARQVMLQRAPESDSAFTVVDAMAGHLIELASSYRSVGAACDGYAEHLDQAHHEILSEITSFIEWTAGIQAAGGLFAICTFGLSEAAAQAGEAAEIGRAAAAIRSAIETLRGLVTAGRAAVDAAAVRVVALAEKVNPILARRIEQATLEHANQVGILRPGEPLPSEIVPSTSATTPEGIALDKLDQAVSLPEITVTRQQIEKKFEAHAEAFGVELPRGRPRLPSRRSRRSKTVRDRPARRSAGSARYLGTTRRCSTTTLSRGSFSIQAKRWIVPQWLGDEQRSSCATSLRRNARWTLNSAHTHLPSLPIPN